MTASTVKFQNDRRLKVCGHITYIKYLKISGSMLQEIQTECAKENVVRLARDQHQNVRKRKSVRLYAVTDSYIRRQENFKNKSNISRPRIELGTFRYSLTLFLPKIYNNYSRMLSVTWFANWATGRHSSSSPQTPYNPQTHLPATTSHFIFVGRYQSWPVDFLSGRSVSVAGYFFS